MTCVIVIAKPEDLEMWLTTMVQCPFLAFLDPGLTSDVFPNGCLDLSVNALVSDLLDTQRLINIESLLIHC